ncbi:MAG: hypothetical protein JXR70_16985 [Spirochaetales bacterium]|nr:hypothetical protein [Spirochaetales bacterium]
MSGLYRRALSFLKQSFSPAVESSELSYDEDSGIPIEEQKEIITQIESVVAGNRIIINKETMELHPEKNGAFALLIIWAIAIVLAVAGFFIFQFVFYTQQQNEMSQSVGSQMNEEFLRTLRQQSEQKLTQAEENIKELQNQLTDFEKQKANLEATMQDQINAAKEKLAKDMEADIQAELEKLRKAGQVIDAAAEEQIREQRAAEYDQLLANAQAKAEQDKKEAEAALNQALQSINNELAQSNKEKQSLQSELADYQKQQEELQKELEAERKANAAKAAESSEAAKEAEARLAELREKQKQESLLVDNILTQYKAIQNFIDQKNYTKALETVSNIRNIYKTADVVAFENLKKRQEIDLFLSNFIESSIKQIQSSSKVDTENLLTQSRLVNAMSSKIAEANRSYQDGNFTEAKQLYLDALELLPEMKAGYENLERIRNQSENSEFKSLAYNANLAYVKGDYSRAIEYYQRALKTFPIDNTEVNTMVTRMLEAGYQTKGDATAISEDDGASKTLLSEGTNYLNSKQFSKAVDSYIDIISKYPRSQYVGEAKLGIQKAVKSQNELLSSTSASDIGKYMESLEEQKKQIAQYESELKSRESELAKIASDLNSKNSEISNLKSQQETNSKTLSNQSKELTQLKQVESQLKKEITDLEYEISLLEKQAAGKESVSQPSATAEPIIITPEPLDLGTLAVTAMSEETRQKLNDYAALEEQIESLKDKYQNYLKQEDEIYNQLGPIGLMSTKPLLGDTLNQELAKELFPDLYTRINRFNDALYNDAKELGSEDAIDTVLTIINGRQKLSAGEVSTAYWQQAKTQYKNDEYILSVIKKLEVIMK